MEEKGLAQLYASHTGSEPALIAALPGAGSNRKYYRITDSEGNTVIGVIGTSAEENKAFCTLAEGFAKRGLNTPRVLCHAADYSAYLQEDLGSVSLFDSIKSGRENGGDYSPEEEALVAKTIALLPRMQFEGAGDDVFSNCYPQREMDRTSVMFDLNYFKYDFLKLTGIEFNEYKLQPDLEAFADELLSSSSSSSFTSSSSSSSTFLYRDFQARNVMLKDGSPYFIDFQGGRKGPIYYDVASFLWQASAKFSDSMRDRMIDVYLEALQPYRIIAKSEFMPKLRFFVLFRLLQVLGAYGYRGLWEKKKHFIDSIPPAVDNLRKELSLGTCDAFPQLKQVCHQIIDWQARQPKPRGGIRVYSFSFKKGIPQDTTGNGGGYVFDCRGSNNPGRYDEYKPLTGLDQPVIDFLEKDGEILRFLDSIYPIADFHVQRWLDRGFSDLMFCFGCTGGRHRSVYSAQHLAEHIHEKFGVEVYLCHRERGIEQILEKNKRVNG